MKAPRTGRPPYPPRERAGLYVPMPKDLRERLEHLAEAATMKHPLGHRVYATYLAAEFIAEGVERREKHPAA